MGVLLHKPEQAEVVGRCVYIPKILRCLLLVKVDDLVRDECDRLAVERRDARVVGTFGEDQKVCASDFSTVARSYAG